jgi:isoprenylcysteine carboxyl methyltransferase (ICMT) family protein YpbQ|tara:strand:- start:411 stop:545 length:135 start_codon:yes stop_codon:yes gene_type:complete
MKKRHAQVYAIATAYQIAALYSVLNESLLYHRIKVENAALEARR